MIVHPAHMNVRKLLLPLHLWTGLTLGLVLVVMAVSGALLTFRHQLERRVDPQRFVVEPGGPRLAPEDLVARALRVHPESELESIRFYADPTAPFLVYFANKDYVHLNPYTGAVLGIRKRYGESFGWIEGLHKYLQVEPSIGEFVTGYSALVFGFITLTGLVLWWPATRRALKAGLTLNPRLSGRPWNLNLHKTIGVYAALVLLVCVATGVPISLDWAKDSFYVLTGSRKVLPPAAAPAAGPFAGFDAAARRMAAVMPGAQETYIPLPKKGLVTAYAIERDAGHPNARSYVWLEPATAALLKASPYREAGAGFRLYYWGMSLHTGVWGGPVVQIILLLGSLAVPVLAYTGTASYLKRRAGRAAAAAAN